MMVGGDRDQVVAQIADLYIARRDILLGSGSKRGITVSAPTNEDVAEISQAIRQRLKAARRDRRRRDAPPGHRPAGAGIRPGPCRRRPACGCSGAPGARSTASEQQVGNNGDVVEVLAQSDWGLRIRTKEGEVADVEWRRLADRETGRLMLGFGHALTIDAAQGITSDEHINALPRGTSGVTAFTTYVAESRSRGTTWTVISEGALYEAERHRQALGDITPITKDDLWARAAEDMSEKPYKALGIDLLAAALRGREQAVDAYIATHHVMEDAQLNDPDAGPKAFRRLQAAAVNENLARHLQALDHAIAENAALVRDTLREREATDHLRALRAEAKAAAGQMEDAGAKRVVRSHAVRCDRPSAVIPAPHQRHESWAAASALDGSL